MKIGEFLKTDKGSHWSKSLSDYSKYLECELYSNVEEYLQMLDDNCIEYDEEEERNNIAYEACRPDYESDEFVIVIMKKWYAVISDDYDAWDYGSEDYEEAVKMLKEQGEGYIAVIENGDFCTEEIKFEDIV